MTNIRACSRVTSAATFPAIRHRGAEHAWRREPHRGALPRRTAPKDGTAIANSIRGLSSKSLVAPDRFNVKFSDYQWLGGMSREVTHLLRVARDRHQDVWTI